MKSFATLLLCLFAFNVNAQQAEIEQLISMRSIESSEILDICAPDLCSINYYMNETLPLHLSIVETHKDSFENESTCKPHYEIAGKKVKFRSEAYLVQVVVLGGFLFHIADHSDGVRVITALDGDLRGLQVTGVNGIIIYSNSNVEWHKNYFLHHYPSAKTTSYPNRQIMEAY